MITIFDWCGCGGLKGTGYQSQQEIEGGIDKALEISKELYQKHHLNVMLLNKGPDLIVLAVDTRNFGQR